MTGNDLLKMTDELEKYLASFDALFGRSESREHFRCFARGQLGTLERKSLEPMADLEGVPPRGLQQFFSQYRWDEDGVRDSLQKMIAQKYGRASGVLIIDETSDAKKGEWTAGVAPQYCGESGKIDNCIVTVHLAVAYGSFHALLDGELFLPKCWDPNPEDPLVTAKRELAGVPDSVVHVGKAELALGQLKRAKANGVPGDWVGADEFYGGKPWWRKAVAGEQLNYVVEIPKSTAGWASEPKLEIPPYKGTGRPGKARPVPAAQPVERLAYLAAGLRFKRWQRFQTHDTQKGPDVWEVKAGRFWEQSEHAPAGSQWLLVARNVRTDEVKYFLSNAPEGTPLLELVRVAFSRWHVERCFEDCKTELGLNHAEMRNYKGLQRHLILTAVNYYFLQDQVALYKREKNGGVDRQSTRGRIASAA